MATCKEKSPEKKFHMQRCKSLKEHLTEVQGGGTRTHCMNFPLAAIPGCANISFVNWNNGSTV